MPMISSQIKKSAIPTIKDTYSVIAYTLSLKLQKVIKIKNIIFYLKKQNEYKNKYDK